MESPAGKRRAAAGAVALVRPGGAPERTIYY